MSNNDLAMRFTENYYATKNEVSKELKISVIDGVWDKILSYRSLFYQYLSVKGIDKNQLRICLCPTVSNKVTGVKSKLNRLLNEYRRLDRVSGDAQYYEQANLIKSLQNIALKRNLVSDEETIRNIIHGQGNERVLSNYHDALRYIAKKYDNQIDVDFLAELYSLVTGNPELTSFYRDFDNEDINSSSIISRVYRSAPHQLIESMMDGLFNFINNGQFNGAINKAIITFYYVEFVKPFKNYNDEIATLLAKAVLAHDSLGELGAYFPFEALLNDNQNDVNRLFYEVQMTSDITYYLTYALDNVDRIVSKLLDNLAEYSVKIIKNDFYKADDVEEKTVEQVSLFENIEEPKEEIKVEVKVEAPLPAPEIKKVESAPKKEVEVVTPKVEVIENKSKGLAVAYIPDELDEKAAARLERHLLELDIRLKKDQAYFYARHCTLGMYYTIDQYKKACKCVYETARTSMEKLVQYGYYVKVAAGKKFVFTPVDRK